MNTLQNYLEKNLQTVKKALPSEDVLTYEFSTLDNVPCALVYADGLVNKQILGELIARPFSYADLAQKIAKNDENTQNHWGRYENNKENKLKS